MNRTKSRLLMGLAAFVVATPLLGCGSGSWCPPWGTEDCYGPPGSGGSPASCGVGLSLWECNVVGGPNTVPFGAEQAQFLGASCGSFYCATSETDAQNQTGAAGDPSLSCASAIPTWTSCITSSCNACDDGEGGMLQSNGEHCAGDDETPAPPGGPSCCHGLTCVGAAASEMGMCVGTPQCAQGPVEQCKQACDNANTDCIAKCPPGNKNCMNNCNQVYGKCLKDCEK